MTEQAWWVQKWLELLDSYRFKKRLERARLYAREGNVLSIDFEDSQVIARVQGSEPEPYIVDLSLAAFSDEEWDYIIKLLSKKAIYSAQLLTGQMPDNRSLLAFATARPNQKPNSGSFTRKTLLFF